MAKSGTPDFRKKRKTRRRPAQQTFRRGTNKMVERLEESGMGKYKIIYDPGGVKMSEVLSDFVEPYEHVADSEDALRKLLAVALVAWNTALMSEEAQAESLEKFAQTLPDDAAEDFYAIVEEMIERKNSYFSEYTRFILDYELTDLGDEYHLSVISTPNIDSKDE